MNLLQFTVPPFPHYILAGFETNGIGTKHVARHHVGVFDLLYVTEGCLYMGEGDRTYEVGEGCALTLRPDQYHYGTKGCRQRTSYYWVHFQASGPWSPADAALPLTRPDGDEDKAVWSLNARPFQIQLPQFARLLQPASMDALLRQLVHLQASAHLSSVRWRQETLFQEMLQLLSASFTSPAASPRIACAEQAAAYLRKHYKEEVNMQELGDSLNFHPVYIARCMQSEFGCSPVEYLLRYRIEQAKLLLLQTDYPMTRIAEEVGFNQASYFTSRFTKYEGIPPRKYRQRFSQG
ncbi:AraC family transcriptional regulator [Paenibacillus gansuensis]|uniref:AraC family transcriptional regulator n=1 Tax=Paenibacillus gansuensis TaxID=306542 RepID=A0ABW5PJW4_9BACL